MCLEKLVESIFKNSDLATTSIIVSLSKWTHKNAVVQTQVMKANKPHSRPHAHTTQHIPDSL